MCSLNPRPLLKHIAIHNFPLPSVELLITEHSIKNETFSVSFLPRFDCWPDSLNIVGNMIGSPFHIRRIFIKVTQHNGALKRGNEDRGYLVCVYSRANLLALYAFVHNTMNGGAPTIHGGSRTVSQRLVGIICLDSRIENRAATGNRGVFYDPLKDGNDSQETLYRVPLPGKRLAHALLNQSIRVIERFQGQLFFTGEM